MKNKDEKRFFKFTKKITEKVADRNISEAKNTEVLDCIPLIKGKQCVYVMDWAKHEIVYSRGIKDMLGYEPDEFDMDMAFSFIHPEDKLIVSRIVKGTVKNAIKIAFKEDDNYALVTYRVQKKDTKYIKVLRQSSTWELDSNNQLLSSYSILSDISFISNNDNRVEWELYANGVDAQSFKLNIHKEFDGFFTKREVQIIKLIEKNYTSEQIAKTLYISFHTVKTHRKTIFKKANCHSKAALIQFCKKNGIL